MLKRAPTASSVSSGPVRADGLRSCAAAKYQVLDVPSSMPIKDFIATQPEYTPPVIYSNSQRSRLVFLVEARPEPAQALRLHPGQPLEVRPLAVAASGSSTGRP